MSKSANALDNTIDSATIPIAVVQYVDASAPAIPSYMASDIDVDIIPETVNHQGVDSLTHRIQTLTLEREQKIAMINQIQDELLLEKKSLIGIVGEVFIKRIEEDPDWSKPDSSTFETKFLQHEMPAVVDIARKIKQIETLKLEGQQIQSKLDQLHQDKEYNDLLPGEIYRMIQDLKSEVVALQERVQILEQLQPFGLSFKFSPAGNASWDDQSKTLQQIGDGVWTVFVSKMLLPNDRVTRWQATMSLTEKYTFMGIAGPLTPGMKYSSTNSTVHAWYRSSTVYVGGQRQVGLDGWPGWEAGDHAAFAYDPQNCSLTVQLDRTNKVYSIHVNLPQAFIYGGIHHKNDKIQFKLL